MLSDLLAVILPLKAGLTDKVALARLPLRNFSPCLGGVLAGGGKCLVLALPAPNLALNIALLLAGLIFGQLFPIVFNSLIIQFRELASRKRPFCALEIGIKRM